MNRRVEFTLNLDDPVERAIYETLSAALRHRRAGELIRQALVAFVLSDRRPAPMTMMVNQPSAMPNKSSTQHLDAAATAQIIDRSANMFGF